MRIRGLSVIKYFVTSFAILTFTVGVKAQEGEPKELIQFTGRVFDNILQPLPYAHILVLNSSEGTITDRYGKFSFIVHPNDSVMFSTVGYRKSIIIVPDTLETPFFTRDVLLDGDTIMFEAIEVYPWKDYEEFKEAFVNLELPDDDLERARRNIALIKTQILLDETPSSRANFNQVMEQQYRETFNRGTYPTYQIFNAFAWAKFFQAIKNGDFKNQ